MEFIEIEYNRNLMPLETVLSGVKRRGDFFVSGALEMPIPKVDVDGVGTLSFPVPQTQIAALVRHAERAPYGRGDETVVDTSVRKVWQIAPSKVRISGKSWPASFEAILSNVRNGLGCEDRAVSAELYKLLVYDRDGFFLPHRDTEKTDGMFGTLVVTLPSPHRGGELRIRHAGREVTIDTSAVEFSALSYAAFYADCEHEALTVTAGNRVCLIYNLVQESRKGKARKLRAPAYESEIAEAAAILERSLPAADAPAKIVWLLAHQYTPAGLSFSALKGADAAKAGVLVRAAALAQCAAHLGIVHIGESGAAEPDYDSGYGSRYDRYRYADEDEDEDDEEQEEEEDDDDADFDVVTVDDVWRYIDEWRDSADRAVELGPIPLADGELLPADALDGEAPDRQKLTEATGNEGASYERSYHRAALVLWHRDRYADVLLQAGVVACLPYLKQLTAGDQRARQEAASLAERMIDVWARDADRYSYLPGVVAVEPKHRKAMIAALRKLGVAALLERFIADVIVADYDGSENAALVSSVKSLDDATAARALSAIVSARLPGHPQECAELLLALSKVPSRCHPQVAESVVAGLERIAAPDAEASAPYQFDDDYEECGPEPLGPRFLENLFEALPRFANGMHCNAAAEKVCARPETFHPVSIVVPALDRILQARGRNTAASESSARYLWTRSAEWLLGRSAVPPQPPADWRFDVRLECSCADCRELQAFVLDPGAQVHRFRVKKERRQHLHNVIDEHRLDMTHATERIGSPQTLVCTKDRRTFERRMVEYGDEIGAMRTLVALAAGSDFSGELTARMQRAVELAPVGRAVKSRKR